MKSFKAFLLESQNIYDAVDILKSTIAGSEYEYRLYIAGGFTRDELLGRDPKDIDLVVDGPPTAGMDAATFIAKKLGVYKEGSNPVIFPTYGTAKLSFDVNGETIDVEFVAPRKEKYEPGSRKPIVFAGTLEDDAKRRDFTVNALFKNLTTNEIKDLTGRGIRDLDAKVLNTSGDPDWIFSEDPLRILRAIRFALKYDFKLPMTVIRAIKKAAPSLKNISKERIQDELGKILVLSKPSRAIRLFKITKILDEVLPEFNGLIKMKQNAFHNKDAFGHTISVLDKTDADLIQRLAALFHDIGKSTTRTEKNGKIQFIDHQLVGAKMAREILTRLKYPNEIIEKVVKIIELHMDLKQAGKDGELIKDSTLRSFVFRASNVLEPLLSVINADNISHSPEFNMPNQILKIKEKLSQLDISKILNSKSILDGNQIMELGATGRLIGDIKDRILQHVIKNPDFTKEQAISVAKNMIAGNKKFQ